MPKILHKYPESVPPEGELILQYQLNSMDKFDFGVWVGSGMFVNV